MTRRRLLPGSLEDLRGLRAARYRRESTEDQGTKYGPAEQDDEIDRFIARYGLVDTGTVFTDHHSGWHRSEARPEFLAMMEAAAGGTFDVLVVAYFSRFSRNVRQALEAHDILHRGGVAIAFADERFVSSDEDAWEDFVDEAVAAEKFSRKLSRRIRNTLRTKFERWGDQAGSPGLGFVRTPQPESRLAIDPETMPLAVALFREYSVGDVSYEQLAERHGMAGGAVRAILSNRLYNGWAARHRRGADEQLLAAPWRASPPVSDELWERVESVRQRRLRSAGGAKRHPHLLAGRIWCRCGRAVRGEPAYRRDGTLVRRYRHAATCEHWTTATRPAHVFDDVIAAQLGALRHDAVAVQRILARAGTPLPPPDTELRRRALERELKQRAEAHAARRLTTEAYLAEHTRITAEIDGLVDRSGASATELAEPDEIARFLADVGEAWRLGGEAERAALVAAIYDRIEVTGDGVASVTLTEAAIRHGLLELLPSRVRLLLARPARLELTTFWSATRCSIH